MLLIGRLDDCDVVLLDRTVSRHHAALVMFGGRWFVIDHGSTNGTWVNNRRIWGLFAVRPGDELRLGLVSLRLGPPYTRNVPGLEDTVIRAV